MRADEAAGFAHRIQPYLSNPFLDQVAFGGAGDVVWERRSEVPVAIAALVDAGRMREARWLALALRYHQLRSPPAVARAMPVLAEPVSQALRLDPVLVSPFLAAADRCARRLRGFVGESAGAQRIRAQVWRACFGPSLEDGLRLVHVIREQNVLVLGETGTGKEIIAEALMEGVPAPAGAEVAPRQSLNAAAIPADLLESELFGHVRGAFSDAHKARVGKIAEAHGGTLFLDEVGDLDGRLQPKLLRAIEVNRVTPVGSNDEITVDVRYVAATSQPLQELVRRGQFRADLYERLAGVVLRVPPLRDRLDDVPMLAEAILDRLLEKRTQLTGKQEISWAVQVRGRVLDELATHLRSYDWPGNVRELENLVRTRLLGFDEEGEPRPPRAAEPALALEPSRAGDDAVELDEATRRVLAGKAELSAVVDWYIERVYRVHEGNQQRAARALGIDRGTLVRHLKLR